MGSWRNSLSWNIPKWVPFSQTPARTANWACSYLPLTYAHSIAINITEYQRYGEFSPHLATHATT